LSGKFFEKLLSGEIFGNLLIARSFQKVTFFHVRKITKCHASIHKIGYFTKKSEQYQTWKLISPGSIVLNRLRKKQIPRLP
jgi:hypothetical protein